MLHMYPVCITYLNSSVVKYLLFVQEVPGVFLRPDRHLLHLQHVLSELSAVLITHCKSKGAYDFFVSLVNKRLCITRLNHCLNVHSVVLCMLRTKYPKLQSDL